MRIISSQKLWLLGVIVTLTTLACGISIPSGTTLQTVAPTIQQVTKAAQANPTRISTIAAQVQTTPAPTLAPLQVPAELANEDAVITALYQRSNPSVVNIITYASDGQFIAPAALGSGFVFDGQGHIATNAHVVHGADAVDVVFSDDTTLTAQVLGQDLHSDLAVLGVDHLPPGVQPLPLADISKVQVGQTVVAIGNPFGLGGTLTRGVVSAIGRTIPALTIFEIPQAIQTDAPINPGNSGGPLLNLQGQVIGINAQIETGNNGNQSNSGVGFAIPVSIISKVIPALITDHEYKWAWMGVVGGTLNPTLKQAMNLPVDKGAYVSEVIQGGPASKAGLRGSTGPRTVNGRQVEVGGDVIIAVDGNTVNSFVDILVYLALNTKPGQVVTLTIVRDGKTQDIKLTLEPRPNDLQQPNQP